MILEEFQVARARSCIYLLFSKFLMRDFVHYEAELAMQLLSDSAQVLPEHFWTEKVGRAQFGEMLARAASSRRENAFDFSPVSMTVPLEPPRPTPSLSHYGTPFVCKDPAAATPCAGGAQVENILTLTARTMQQLHRLTDVESEFIMEGECGKLVENRFTQTTFLWTEATPEVSFLKTLLYWEPSTADGMLARLIDVFTELDRIYLSFMLVQASDLFTELENISLLSTGSRYGASAIGSQSRPTGNGILLKAERRLCSLCGTCCRTCEQNALEVIQRGAMVALRHLRNRCVGCGDCLRNCPAKALLTIERAHEGDSGESILVVRHVSRCLCCGRIDFPLDTVYERIDLTETDLSAYLNSKFSLCDRCRSQHSA